MIIITDAHISTARGNHTAFFRMLAKLEAINQDLVFLGDIFDLWVALPRYEEGIHRDFADWCRDQKQHRTIGYMEGNHEYYIAEERKDAFTWCSEDPWRQDDEGCLFVHGDQVNRKDRNYLTFRKLVKNKITKRIIRCLPYGPKILNWTRQGLKQTNIDFRLSLPHTEIETFAQSRFLQGADIIFVGHFHQEYTYRHHESKELYVLPDWYSTQKVSLFQHDPRVVTTVHWEELDG
jgi:UDP-2,3-diacylglucosamine pyrophosphatase LpxH